jgi:hypothetical protein
MARSQKRHGNAFQRLHKDGTSRRQAARERQQRADQERAKKIERQKFGMSAISKALSDARTDLNGAENYGDKLFREGELHQRQKERLLEHIRQQEEEKKLVDENVTFQPQISEYARSKKSTVLDDYTGAKKAQKQDLYAQLRAEKEMQDCHFKPAIPAESVELAKQRAWADAEVNPGSTVTEALLRDGERRTLQQAAYQTWHPDDVTFKPDIGVNKYRPRADADDDAFVERLMNSNRERERHLQLIRAERQADVDNETGRPLFKPRTGNEVEPGTRGGVPIWEQLHGTYAETHEVRDTLRQRNEQHMKDMANQCHTKGASEKLVDERKRRRARHIFDVLDRGGAGVLDPQVGSTPVAALRSALSHLMNRAPYQADVGRHSSTNGHGLAHRRCDWRTWSQRSPRTLCRR